MAQTLAQLVRAKHPGAYDDISDEDLEAKVETKFPGAYSDIPRTSKMAPPFPTPVQTAGRTIVGGLKAADRAALGMMEGATAPLMAPMREVASFVQGKPSPAKEQFWQSVGAVQRGDYLGAVPVVGPLAKQVGQGLDEITTPYQKAMIAGAGTISPEEMNTAADTGGAAIANIAAPEIARGGVAVAGKITPSMGKLLKFAPPAALAVSGHPIAALKMVAKGALTEAILKPMGNIIIDHVLDRIAARDADGAAAALAKGLEKSPEAAKALAATLEQEANKVAPAGAPMFSPMDGSPEAVAARNAAKRARLGSAPAPTPVVAPGASSALQRPAFVDEARGVNLPPDTSMPPGYPRGAPVNPGPWEPVDALPEPARTPQMPVPGNVKPATVFTKPGPKVKPPAGESEAARTLAEKQKTVAAPDLIRAAFGTPAPTQAQRIAALAEKQRGLAPEGAIREAFSGPAEPGPIRFHDDPVIDAKIKESLPLIADALRRGKGTPKGFIETGNHSGDLRPYGATDTGVKAALGLDDMPQSRKVIADALERDKGNPVERAVAKRIGTQIEQVADDPAPFDVESDIPHQKKGPSGAPLTAAERKEALIKLQRAIAADQDVFSAFGLEN